MRYKELINEVPAIAGRTYDSKPYVNPNGQLGNELRNYVKPNKADNQTTVYAFPDLKKEPTGQFPSVEALDRAVARINKFVGGNLQIMNNQQRNEDPSKFLGFAVSYWVNKDGKRIPIGKYLYNTKNAKKGHGNQVSNYLSPKHFDAHDLGPELGYMPSHRNAGFDTSRYPTAQANTNIKTTNDISNLEPTYILNINESYKPKQVLAAVNNKFNQTAPALVKLTSDVIKGGQKAFSIDYTGIKLEELNKDFTELLHPLALISNSVEGNIPKFNYKNSEILYTSSSGSLYDSILRDNATGQKLYISSKYGSGTAPAMGQDFLKLLNQYRPTENEKPIYDIFSYDYFYWVTITLSLHLSHNTVRALQFYITVHTIFILG